MENQSLPENVVAQASKYTAIWQSDDPSERRWVAEIFGPYLGDQVIDGRREIVLDNSIVFDYFVNSRDPAYYRKFRGLNAFLVDFSDESYDFIPEIYINFRGILRCYWSDVFKLDAIRLLPLGYTNNLDSSESPPKKATERQYVWSFLGQVNKSTRPDMIQHLARVEPHLLFSTDDLSGLAMWNRGTGGKARRYSKTENGAILRDSLFAPCPMGNVNLECFRVYEALEAGCIPIVENRLTLDYFRELFPDHPMPAVRSWREGRRLIARLLENPEELNVLQSRCIAWWDGYKHDYRLGLGEFLQQRSALAASLTVEDLVQPNRRFPGWKLVELLRHHDIHAFLRRIRRTFARVVVHRKLRVTYGAGNRG